MGNVHLPGMVMAIPVCLAVVKADPDREVRMSAAAALDQVQDLDLYKITSVLTDVLKENGRDAVFMRYKAAITLASHFESKAPDETINVLPGHAYKQ